MFSKLAAMGTGGTVVEFDRALTLDTGDASRAVAIGDLDGDGKAEVVTVVRTQPAVVIHQNIGGRQFTRLTPISLGSSFVPELVHIHDLNQDGRPEIIVTYSFESAVTIYRNVSTGPSNISFAARADRATLGLQSHGVAFGDIDNDGRVDMLVSSRQVSSGISIFRNISGGSSEVQFASRVDILIASPNWAIALADLDADDRLDIITLGNETSRDMWVLRNISSGAGNISFASELVFDLPTSVWNYFPGDFDGDGKIDIAYTIANQSSIGIFRNTTATPGTITLAAPQSFEVGLAPFWVIMKDFDLDGKPDMASVNSNGNAVTIRSNLSSPGNLSFASRDVDHGGGLRTYHFDAGDIDGDGKPDIAIANLDEGTTSVLFNEGLVNGTLRFKGRKDYLTENRKGVRSVTAGDFNNDGIRDVAIGTDFRSGNSSLFVYTHLGQGEFTRSYASPSGSLSVVALETTDLDNDGREDVVFLEPGATRFLRNVSDGSGPVAFAAASTPTQLFPRDVLAGDLDGDGKNDLVIKGGETQTSPDSMVILRNISTGPGSIQFTVVRALSFPENSYLISGIEDLDGDGLSDIVLNPSTPSISFIRILRHQGQFNFATTDIANQPESLVNPGIGDLDGDGKPELVSGFRFSRSIYRNLSTPGNIAFPERIDIPNSILGEHHIADVDGDGRKDVFSRRYSTIYGSFEVFRNTSTGTGQFSFEAAGRFAYGANFNATGNETDTIIDDLNNDGMPDLVARFSANNFGSFSVHLNKTNLSQRAPYDMDGDGKTDVSVFRA
ncbi:MAG TPA: VCBS repeat-containing protein, partial [Pyrinomonadaceae bacterium]|nr:VCBS repeat-containing protein [Pyrinomonadaceae bacterium]